MTNTGELITYIFYRGDSWYPIFLKDDKEAVMNAMWNAGTTRVEDLNGRIIWEQS